MTHAVRVAEMVVSACRNDVLICHALGSCLGVLLYDPVAGVGGMLQAMLPSSAIDPRRAAVHPSMFVDTGVHGLLRECCRLGAKTSRLVVKVAGGANLKAGLEDDYLQVGRRNLVALRRFLWRHDLLIQAADVGGSDSRTLSVQIGTWETRVKSGGESRPLGIPGRSVEGPEPSGVALTVLVVDDSGVMRHFIRKTFGLCGLPLDEIHEARDGQEGLDLLRSRSYDLALVDLHMPGPNGGQMIERLTQGREPVVPVILALSIDGRECRLEAMRPMGVELLKKPFTPEGLRDAVLRTTGAMHGQPAAHPTVQGHRADL